MPTQCYLANCESLHYRLMLVPDLLSEFKSDDSGIAVKILFRYSGMSLLAE